jgi:GT2 family glycosyltransferase
MKFHFFITAFNDQDNLNDTVESLLKIIGQEKLDEYSITIHNDASTDGTIKIIYDLSKKYREIKIINNNLNLGVCCSLKKFLTEIQGGKLVLISGDNEIGSDLIKNLIISSRDHDFVISYNNFREFSKLQF